MYKKRFRDWGWRKNITHELAVEAARKRALREEDGCPASVVLINGKEVPESRLERHFKRHKADRRKRKYPCSPWLPLFVNCCYIHRRGRFGVSTN